jgi:HEAT repeat protein
LIGQFVVFPLTIVLVGVGIYLLLGFLTSEDRSAEDYLNTIRIGGISSRWQAAHELVKVLAEEQRRGGVSPKFIREMIRVFETSRSDDPRVRRFLARAMEMVEDPAFVPVLISALEDPDDETRIYATLSLGAQGDPRAVPPLIEMASSDDAGIRKAAVYALGQLRDARTQPVLLAALRDRAPDVRWNAALQLAEVGNNAGLEVLGEMLNPEYLETFTQMSGEDRRKVMVGAIRALGRLDDRSMVPTLLGLREGDPDMKVRQAAIEVLGVWGK